MISGFKIKFFAACVICLLLCIFAMNILIQTDYFSKVTANITYDIISSEDIMFLAQERIRMKVVAPVEDNSFWLGKEKVIIQAPVSIIYGFDLNKVSMDDIIVTKKDNFLNITVEMPEYEKLSFEIDTANARILDQSANLPKLIYNRMQNKNILQEAYSQIYSIAMEEATLEGIISRDKSIRQLQEKINNNILLGILDILGIAKVTLE